MLCLKGMRIMMFQLSGFYYNGFFRFRVDGLRVTIWVV